MKDEAKYVVDLSNKKRKLNTILKLRSDKIIYLFDKIIRVSMLYCIQFKEHSPTRELGLRTRVWIFYIIWAQSLSFVVEII